MRVSLILRHLHFFYRQNKLLRACAVAKFANFQKVGKLVYEH